MTSLDVLEEADEQSTEREEGETASDEDEVEHGRTPSCLGNSSCRSARSACVDNRTDARLEGVKAARIAGATA